MTGLAYVDGGVVPLDDAKVPLMDRGHLLGDGLFETLRTANGEIFRRDDHAKRLRHGLKVLGMNAGIVTEYDQAIDALLEAARKTIDGDVMLRIQVSRGLSKDVPGLESEPKVNGLCRRYEPYPHTWLRDGIALRTATQRKDASDPLSTVKSLSFLPYMHARREALRSGADDAILLNMDGRVAEATTSNVFAVVNDVLHAPGPSEGALAGVTRQAVLELADERDLTVTEELLSSSLQEASEAFLTNTLGGVIPAVSLDGRPIGNGSVGAVTRQFQTELESLMVTP